MDEIKNKAQHPSAPQSTLNKTTVKTRKLLPLIIFGTAILISLLIGGVVGAEFFSEEVVNSDDTETESTVEPTIQQEELLPTTEIIEEASEDTTPTEDSVVIEKNICADRTYSSTYLDFDYAFDTICDQNVYIGSSVDSTVVYINDEHVHWMDGTDALPGYLTLSLYGPDSEQFEMAKTAYENNPNPVEVNPKGVGMKRLAESTILGNYVNFNGKATVSGTDYYFAFFHAGFDTPTEIQKVVDTFKITAR